VSAGLTAKVGVIRSLEGYPPKLVAALEAGLARCHTAGLDAFIYESFRSPELQALYYKRGRTVIPPKQKVTNARSNLYSWHGFYLAVDVISRSKEWGAGEEWFQEMAACMKAGKLLKAGIDWKMHDMPHIQWGRCKPSPSNLARTILQSRGMEAVHRAVGAL
jgi:peptidoglycan L-alanyl-D-glutamate endopeptidase CwlK